MPKRNGRPLMAPLGLLVTLLTLGSYAALRPIPTRVPPDAVQSTVGMVDESTCAECHSEADSFAQTGHARTLRPANDPLSLDLLRQMAAADKPRQAGLDIEFRDDKVLAVHRAGDRERKVELKWCFGSGEHACTWTSTLPDSLGAIDLLEFRYTWFHGEGVFDISPGQPQQDSAGYFGPLGVLFDGPKARRCFSCHTTYLPIRDGVIEEAHVRGGVTCQRCHGPRARHVASEGEFRDPRWKVQDQMDAIHRCAQCHRRAEEQPPESIWPGNPDIVRFQPVGLVQSACFQNSAMTCTTCHDPHRPLADQNSRGRWQCIQCHDPDADHHVTCAAGEMDGCIDCHMPSVRMEAPIEFTDHWIRVVGATERKP
ncbi:MAG: hypothetical protein KatS3mg111_1971 [Pirellulaceae bacterium]|nr:MAG: hypothetical protein KatS3mg111_1971 [Pirellulaceae bacterium]